MKSASGMEHRWGKRTAVDAGVTIATLPHQDLPGRLVDIGPGGAFIRTPPHILRVNALVDVRFGHPRHGSRGTYRLAAIVVRLTADGAGIAFNEFDPQRTRHLLALLAAAPQHRDRRPAPVIARSTFVGRGSYALWGKGLSPSAAASPRRHSSQRASASATEPTDEVGAGCH